MPRVGFSPIAAGSIVFGKDGRWYCDGEPIPNRAIASLFSRALEVLPDGRARLVLGEDRAWVTLEDTPWVVTGIDGDPALGFAVALNDGTREPLDPGSLRTGSDHVLYCRVKDGAHEARFLRPAYYALMRFAEPGPGDACELPVGRGRRITLNGQSG
ncbi:MAG: DUF1285 domain-containing protein [Candidatus Binatia bacterium]